MPRHTTALCLTTGSWSSCSFLLLPLTSFVKIIVRLVPSPIDEGFEAKLLVAHECVSSQGQDEPLGLLVDVELARAVSGRLKPHS